MRPFVEANDYSPLQVYPQNGRSMCRREAPLLGLTHPLSVVHRFGGGGDLFDRVRDVACQVDRVGKEYVSKGGTSLGFDTPSKCCSPFWRRWRSL